MDWDRIELLLEKYFEGETGLDEEKELKKFFNGPDVPEHLKKYRALFTYFKKSASEHSEKELDLPSVRRPLKQWLSIAAALVIIFSVFGVYEKQRREKEEALAVYNETVRALNLVASNLNKGNKAIYELNNYNKATRKIFKQE